MTVSIEAIPRTRDEEPRRILPDAVRLTARPAWIYAVMVLLLTGGIVALSEWAGATIFSGRLPVPFSILRLMVASAVAGLSTYCALRQIRNVERRCFEATLSRYRMEEAFSEVQQQLARKQHAEQQLHGAHHLTQAALDALSKHIAILDDQGTVIAVNQAWRRFATENGFAGGHCAIGSNYIDSVNGSSDPDAAAAAQGITEVLQEKADGFRFLYEYSTAGAQRWFQLRVSPFTESGRRRLLVYHEDVTDVKLAQEAQRDIDNRILRSREEERRKIARELHDSTVQKIFTLNLNLMGLKTLLSTGEKRIQDLLAETVSLGRECMQELRTISYLLRPPLPAGHDFLPALNSYIDGFCKRSGIRVNLVLPSHAGRMPANVENVLFRVIQETLSNIHRHSQSATATVLLRKSDECVVLEVKDKGKGMPLAAATGAYRTTGGGLAGIEERVRELEGSLAIRPANPGTIVTATIPLTGPDVQRDAEA